MANRLYQRDGEYVDQVRRHVGRFDWPTRRMSSRRQRWDSTVPSASERLPLHNNESVRRGRRRSSGGHAALYSSTAEGPSTSSPPR